MSKFGGQYLSPTSFFSDSYKVVSFRDESFWMQEMKTWGEITHRLEHSSNPPIEIYKNKKLKTDILISKDGLIAVEVPAEVKSNEEALSSITHHINSFLGLLHYGGILFLPISQKTISHISYLEREGKIEQVGAGGDVFTDTSMKRAMHRYEIPHKGNTLIIDFNWPHLKIYNKEELSKAFNIGKEVVNHTNFNSGAQLLSLGAMQGYVMHDWTQSLIMGWTFIEIMLNQLWKKEVLSHVKPEERGRKKRLEDTRTYSSSVMIEFLYSLSAIDLNTYAQLNTLRKIRNDFIHEGKPIGESDAKKVFDVFRVLIETLTGIMPNILDPGYAKTSGWVEKE